VAKSKLKERIQAIQLSHASVMGYRLLAVEIDFQGALRSLQHEPAISASLKVGAHRRGYGRRETPL
jgi:hypothetical protein